MKKYGELFIGQKEYILFQNSSEIPEVSSVLPVIFFWACHLSR